MVAPVEFWTSDKILAERTKNLSKLHNIFIEGPAGASKKETTARLKMVRPDLGGGSSFSSNLIFSYTDGI